MSTRIRSHLTGNIVGYMALFFALAGVSYAAVAKNSIKSKHIAPNAAKGVDVNESTLAQVPSAASAANAANASALGGVGPGGFVRTGGLARLGSETGGEGVPPGYQGVVVRAVHANTTTDNTVVARNVLDDGLPLLFERDGSNAGFVIDHLDLAGVTDEFEFSCIGVNGVSAVVVKQPGFFGPAAAAEVPVFTDAEDLRSFTCSWGDQGGNGHHTTLELDRAGASGTWRGFVTSTVNQ